MVKPGSRPSLRYRLGVLSRVLAAGLGGYTLAALGGACLAQGLPLARSEALLAATLPAFLVLCGAAIWAFAARSAGRAWLGLLVPSLLLGGLYLMLSGARA